MPIKYRVKQYSAGSYYHIYNRGIDGREIFSEDADYQKFLEILKGYIVPNKVVEDKRFKSDKPSIAARKVEMSLAGRVKVVAYCLMPDHFHLVIQQEEPGDMTKLMRRVNTAYVMYFNKKYKRRGPLFENAYRAGQIGGVGEELTRNLKDLSVFLHLHPVSRSTRRFGPVITISSSRAEDYAYTSLQQYMGLVSDIWVDRILNEKEAREYIKKTSQARDFKLSETSGPLFE